MLRTPRISVPPPVIRADSSAAAAGAAINTRNVLRPLVASFNNRNVLDPLSSDSSGALQGQSSLSSEQSPGSGLQQQDTINPGGSNGGATGNGSPGVPGSNNGAQSSSPTLTPGPPGTVSTAAGGEIRTVDRPLYPYSRVGLLWVGALHLLQDLG